MRPRHRSTPAPVTAPAAGYVFRAAAALLVLAAALSVHPVHAGGTAGTVESARASGAFGTAGAPSATTTVDMPPFTSRVYPGPDGRLVYVPDERGDTIPDFSHAGYCGGGVPIPYVPVRDTVWAVEGNASPVIQAAIDRVSALPPDAHGLRGAVLLMQGWYELRSPLRITAGGVVLRGSGTGLTGTILHGAGELDVTYSDRADARLVVVGGDSAWEPDEATAREVADDYVPVGARSFRVSGAHGFAPGDRVLVRRRGNADWIHAIGQDLDNPDWRWEPFTISFDRVVTAVSGDTVTVDAPLTTSIDRRWGGGDIVRYDDPGRIARSGVENLTGVSDYDQTVRTSVYGNIDRHPYIGGEYYSDERHYWDFIAIDNAVDCWVRNTTAAHFAGSMVVAGAGTTRLTVRDCVSLEPVSLRHGGRRFTFLLHGQLTLVARCASDRGRHSFVLGGPQACGNVFLDCAATVPYNSSEPHYKWANGTLYDNVRAPLTARWWKEISIGWAGANTVFWNCEGPFLIQKPPTAQNFAFGHVGIHATVFNTRYQDLERESGHIESWDRHVAPASLYLAQLRDRLGDGAPARANLAQPLMTRGIWP